MTSDAETEMALTFLPASLGTLAWRKVVAKYEVQLLCDCYSELADSPSGDSSLHPLDSIAKIYCQPCEQTILNVQSS